MGQRPSLLEEEPLIRSPLPAPRYRHSSRAQLNRVLDPEASNVTRETLSRAAKVVGRGLKVELV